MNTARLLTLALAALAFSAAAQASQFTAGVHLATTHRGNAGLESSTPGLYVRHESGATAGGYRNSYGRWSTYAGWTWEAPGRYVAITAGAVTGYPAAKVMPLLVPSVRLPLGPVSARVSYIPKPVKSGTASGLHLSLESEF